MVNGSVGAAAVLGVFTLTALLFKLSHKLYKQRTEAVAALQVACEADCKDRVTTWNAAECSQFEEEKLEEGIERKTKPQTPAEVLALQHGSVDPVSSRPCSPASLRGRSSSSLTRGMATPPRPRSAGMERPRSSFSTRSAWSDSRDNTLRCSSDYADEMGQSNWWAEASQWWPEAVENGWESPYRPSSRNSVRRHPSAKVQDVPSGQAFDRPTLPNHQSTWPSKRYGPCPMKEAFVWATWETVDGTPKARCNGTGVRFATDKAAPAPPPFPETFRQGLGESGAMSWDTRPPSSSIPVAVTAERKQAAAQWQPCRPATPAASIGTAADTPKASSRWHVFYVLGGKAERAKSSRSGEDQTTTRTTDASQSAAETRIASMLKELELTREESLPERKRVFRKLQRELHPDKNVDCEEEAKLAFQELMLQRSCYLRP